MTTQEKAQALKQIIAKHTANIDAVKMAALPALFRPAVNRAVWAALNIAS